MKNTFSYITRKENIAKLKKQKFDLVVIGGGINGAGIARDAASRGMKVAVIEANDFASGTSSRSSKMIHGGIRYLENMEFSLVYEALSERAFLFEMAPHLVHPLRFVLPVYKEAKYGMFTMGVGMFMYDLLSLFESPYLHERLSPEATLESLPSLKKEGLCGSYMYSDAYTDDDRLVIESFRSANDMGACAVNFVEAVKANYHADKINSISCRDIVSNENFEVSGKYFVSATGPWTDIFANTVLDKRQDMLRPTKGIHLTVPKNRVKLNDAVVMTSADQKRIVFGIPRKEMLVFGTTDTDYEGEPSAVSSKAEDVTYLLKVIEEHFPGASLTAKDVIASYAGIRPLVDDGSTTAGKTSREHLIWKDGENISFICGGKYTTYRLIAEEVVDHCLAFFTQEDRMSFGPSKTKLAINYECDKDSYWKSQQLLDYWVKEQAFDEDSLRVLIYRHGLEAFHIVKKYSVSRSTPLWALEAQHAIENTMCLNLDDFYIRRSPLMLGHWNHGLEHKEYIADIFAANYAWNEEERKVQLDRLDGHLNMEMSWKRELCP